MKLPFIESVTKAWHDAGAYAEAKKTVERHHYLHLGYITRDVMDANHVVDDLEEQMGKGLFRPTDKRPDRLLALMCWWRMRKVKREIAGFALAAAISKPELERVRLYNRITMGR